MPPGKLLRYYLELMKWGCGCARLASSLAQFGPFDSKKKQKPLHPVRIYNDGGIHEHHRNGERSH
jgi:hypothetical protein